ncbi:conserved hypothetical protein [Flavobacterium sp. 9AF]|uniref:glycosyltransferase n=1 Tax=Flavobacterium sp. 9AF TaxID=2653142 RepID=UPI0012F3F961|nr:glycosyltransferase [Flavobacterium sp. 9AF]VXC30598.1 conserved hypothetical protein [Flavobacterium sp. 9AF]
MRKKKIVIIMSALNGGGAEKVLIDYLRNFNYSKYEIDLCLVINEGIYLKDIPNEVNKYYLYPKFSIFPYRIEHWFSKFLNWNYFQKRRVDTIFKNKKYDAVLSFMEGTPLKFHQYFIKKSKRHITWIHIDLFKFHYSLSNFKNPKQELSLYNQMNTLVFVSNESANQFDKLYQVNAEKKIIYNLIDKATILKGIDVNVKKNDSQLIKIVAVGRLEIQKRFDRLINVAKLLKEQGLIFQISIIGEGSLREQLQNQIQENNVADNVNLIGFVKSPYNIINENDILVVTSEAEGFSLVVAEALCLGKAVVSTATAGPVELLENGKYGIVCDHNVESISNAVKSLIIDKNLLIKYQELALQRSAIFDVKKSIQEFESIICNG